MNKKPSLALGFLLSKIDLFGIFHNRPSASALSEVGDALYDGRMLRYTALTQPPYSIVLSSSLRAVRLELHSTKSILLMHA
jgi:hypothetical protein